jgi:putative endonuclease
MACHVYVLYSESFRKIYIGYTSNLEKRVQSHNSLATKGWTIKFRPWVLFRTEEFVDKKSALKRERELKSAKGREFIWEMIQKKYPS